MKKILILALIFIFSVTSFAFAKDVTSIALPGFNFEGLDEGEISFSNSGLTGIYGQTAKESGLQKSEDTIKIENLNISDCDSRGKSLVIRKGNSKEGYPSNDVKTYFGISAGKLKADGTFEPCDTETVFEFDFLCSGFIKSPERIKMQLVGYVGDEEKLDTELKISGSGGKNGYFDFSNYTSGQKAIYYNNNVWYKVKYTVNLIDNKYRFELYDDAGNLVGEAATGEIITAFDSLSGLRFSFNYPNNANNPDVGVDKYFAFDNIKITYNDIVPNISKIKYFAENDEEGQDVTSTLPLNISKISLQLDAPLKSEGELKNAVDIKLKNLESNSIKETAKIFKYTKSTHTINLEFDSPLKAGVEYEILLNDNARTSYGNEITQKVSKNFTVSRNSLDVESCTFSENTNTETGTNVDAILNIENSGSGTTVCVIAAVYADNMLKSVKAYNVSVPNGGVPDAKVSAAVDSDEVLEIYVCNSLADMKSISERVFLYKK